MSAFKKEIVTSKDIIEAFNAHGTDFLSLDLDNIRKYQDYAQYIAVIITLANGKKVNVSNWQMSGKGIKLVSRIREPEQRKYEAIRIGFKHDNGDGEVNENTEALKIMCEAFETLMKKLKSDKVITDDEDECELQDDGKTFSPIHLISVKAKSPMQATTIDPENPSKKITLDSPFFWISIPKKKFWAKNEKKPVYEPLEDRFYMDPKTNKPSTTIKVTPFDFACTFYDQSKGFFNSETGKKNYPLLGEKNEEGKVVLNNVNIQEFLTRGSPLVPMIKMEVVVSGRQCKLEMSLDRKVYVKPADANSSDYNNHDEDLLNEFDNTYSSTSFKNDDDDFDLEDD